MITLLLSISCTLSIMTQDAPPTETSQKKDAVGTFTRSMAMGTGAVSQSVALGDLDGDGDLDAFVANQYGSKAGCSIWINDGRAAFTRHTGLVSTPDCSAVTLGDLDGDGDLDAWISNRVSMAPDTVWFNDGNGGFTDSGQRLGQSVSMNTALGDIDGDGDLDAFVANSDWSPSGPNIVWLNDGNGRFTFSGQRLGTANSFGLAMGDLDGDGDLDAWIANLGGPNTIWLNDGNGIFTDSGQALGNAKSKSVALGDLDGDGDLDAWVANSSFGENPSHVWLNDGAGVFTDSGQALGPEALSRTVVLGDLDQDGDLDAFVACMGTKPNMVWLNDGAAVFTDSGQTIGENNTYGAALGDLNGDGRLDAWAANCSFPDRDQPNRIWFNGPVDDTAKPSAETASNTTAD